MVGFQNNSAYDRIWEARKIWGGIVNASRSLIITVRDSFYMHRSEAMKDESEVVRIITNRHIAWLTAIEICHAYQKAMGGFIRVNTRKGHFRLQYSRV